MRPAVFLDRDGTIVHDANYLSRIEDLRWFPFSVDAVRLLNRAGFVVVVTSNQGGIGLEMFTSAFVDHVHEIMSGVFVAGGARIDAWFYCPHHPRAASEPLRGPCECRKPGIGMVRQAEKQFDIDLARSFVVGDRLADLQMAHNAGAGAILVRTGIGEDVVRKFGKDVPAAYVAADLMDAAAWILNHSSPHAAEAPQPADRATRGIGTAR